MHCREGFAPLTAGPNARANPSDARFPRIPAATRRAWVDVSTPFLQVRRATIYGGSSEIQRNIVARRVLNLPQ